MEYYATLIGIIGVLVALTNIIVEVLKNVLPAGLPTSLLAVIVSEVITLVAALGYFSYAGIAVLWYYIAASLVLGLLVSYAAMFGFDKLKEILSKLQ